MEAPDTPHIKECCEDGEQAPDEVHTPDAECGGPRPFGRKRTSRQNFGRRHRSRNGLFDRRGRPRQTGRQPDDRTEQRGFQKSETNHTARGVEVRDDGSSPPDSENGEENSSHGLHHHQHPVFGREVVESADADDGAGYARDRDDRDGQERDGRISAKSGRSIDIRRERDNRGD